MGQQSGKGEKMQRDNPLLAVGLILVAMAMLGLFDNLIALLARDMGLWQFHFLRAVLAISGLGIMARLGLIDLSARRRWAVALRGGLTALSMLIYFGSLAFLSVAETAAGLFTAPIWVLVLSAVFLDARPGWVQIGAAVVGFAGVMLVLNPFAGGVRAVAFLPMLAGLFYAMGALATRQYCVGEGVFVMLLWFFIGLLALGAAGLAGLAFYPLDVADGAAGFLQRGWVWPVSPLAAVITLVQAGVAIIAVAMIFRAYQLGEASHVAVFEYSLLLFAAFWSWVLWRHVPDAQAWLGMGLIAASGTVLTLAARGKSG